MGFHCRKGWLVVLQASKAAIGASGCVSQCAYLTSQQCWFKMIFASWLLFFGAVVSDFITGATKLI